MLRIINKSIIEACLIGTVLIVGSCGPRDDMGERNPAIADVQTDEFSPFWVIDSVYPNIEGDFAPNQVEIVVKHHDKSNRPVVVLTFYEMRCELEECVELGKERVVGVETSNGDWQFSGESAVVPAGIYGLWSLGDRWRRPIKLVRADRSVVLVFRRPSYEILDDGTMTREVLSDNGFDPAKLIPIPNPVPEA